jgi:hypothetical protein
VSDELEIFCHHCHKWRPLCQEPWLDYAEVSPGNAGYLLSDQVCAGCRSVVTVLRRKAANGAPEVATPDIITDKDIVDWLIAGPKTPWNSREYFVDLMRRAAAPAAQFSDT